MNSSAHQVSRTSITPSFIIEAGIQLSPTEDLKWPRLKTDDTVGLSVSIQF
ncbi:MAG: hypothetical protein V3T84_00365 [Phycisphaerales bacterium]